AVVGERRDGQLSQRPGQTVGKDAGDDARAVETNLLKRTGRVTVLRAVADLRRLAVLTDAGEVRRKHDGIRPGSRVERYRGDVAVRGVEPAVGGEAQHRTRPRRSETGDGQVIAVF